MSLQKGDQSLDAHINDLIDKIDVSDCNGRNADLSYSPIVSSSCDEVSPLIPILPSSFDDEESSSIHKNSKKLKMLDLKHPYQESVSMPLLYDLTGNKIMMNTHTETLTLSKIEDIEASDITKHRNVNQVVKFVYKHSQQWPSTFKSVLIDQRCQYFAYLENKIEQIERPLLPTNEVTYKFSPVKLYFTLSNKTKMSTSMSFSTKQQMQNAFKKSRTSLRSSECFSKPSLTWTNSSTQEFELSPLTSHQIDIEETRKNVMCMNKSDNFIRPIASAEAQYSTLNEVISHQSNKGFDNSQGLRLCQRTGIFSNCAADNSDIFPATMRRKDHTLQIIAETSNEISFSNPNTDMQQKSLVPLKASDKINIQRNETTNLMPLFFLEKEENTFDEFHDISNKHTIKMKEPSSALLNEETSNFPKYSEEKCNKFPVTSNPDTAKLQNVFNLDGREDALSAFNKPNKCQNDYQLVPTQDNLNDKVVNEMWQYDFQYSSEIKPYINSNSEENYREKNESEGVVGKKLFDESPTSDVYDKNKNTQEIKPYHTSNKKNSDSILIKDKSFLNSNPCLDIINPYFTIDPEDNLDEEHRVPECSLIHHDSVRENLMYHGQSQNSTDCELQTKGAFYWDISKNSSRNNQAVTSPESPALSILSSIPRLSQCNRPIRLGLSKKQKVKHLHKK